MTKNVAWLAVAMSAMGCGGSNVRVDTSTVKGTVGGVVLDAAAGLMPLKGVTAVVIAGGSIIMAPYDDNTGTWSAKDVPVGSVVVKLSAADHFDAYLTGTLTGNAGNFPLENPALTFGPTAMVSSKGSIGLRLVDQNGAPVNGIKVTARSPVAYLDLAGGTVVARGAVDANGTSSSDGMVTINGLPDFQGIGPLIPDSVTVNIPPTKVMGADAYQFLGLTLNINATSYPTNLGTVPTVVLAGPRTGLTVLSSTLDWVELNCPNQGTALPLGGEVGSSGPITIAFNQAIDTSTLHADLYNEFGSLAAKSAMASASGNVLTISFSGALDPGNRYNIALHADSAYKDQTREFNCTFPFFVAQPNGTNVTVSQTSRIDPNNPNDFLLIFSEPIGVGFSSTAPVYCVTYYEADLDGNGQVTSGGEWSAGGNSALRCDKNIPGLTLRPDEAFFGVNQGTPITGFTTQWRLGVKAACVPNYLCNTSGKTVHLVFSRNADPSSVVKRANGVPVPDLTFTLPAF
jgi:Bacterial Ig-like domain